MTSLAKQEMPSPPSRLLIEILQRIGRVFGLSLSAIKEGRGARAHTKAASDEQTSKLGVTIGPLLLLRWRWWWWWWCLHFAAVDRAAQRVSQPAHTGGC